VASKRLYLLTVSVLALAPLSALADGNSATQSLQNFDSVFQSIEQNNPSNGQSTNTTGGAGTTLPALTLIAPPLTLSPTDYQTLLGDAQTTASTYFGQAQAMAASYVVLLGGQTLASMFESLTLGLLDSPYASPPSNYGGTGTNGGGGNPSTGTALPCDAAATAGTPCSAAHSVTRLLTKNYTGPLFQVQRASDNTTQDIYPYTSSTLAGASATLVGSANVASANTFCASTTCAITILYDQIDLVGPLKGTYGNVTGSITLNADGSTTSLTIPAGGGAASQTVPIVAVADPVQGHNQIASLTLPNSGGTLTVQLTFAPAPTKTTPAQVTIGNDLPAVTASGATPTAFGLTKLGQNVQIPALTIPWAKSYRNRTGTVNQSLGDTEIAEYMVAGAQYYPAPGTCCGTYGNMEASANASVFGAESPGMMFAVAYASGDANVDGYGPGYSPTNGTFTNRSSGVNWPGVDAEAGVYYFGPPQPATETFVTSLAKYSPAGQSNVFAIKGGDASQNVLTALYDQAPPPALNFSQSTGKSLSGRWEGGLGLGEGGDAASGGDGQTDGAGGAPVQFFEGAIITKTTTDATDNAIQASVASFYGPPADTNVVACYANNLVSSPLGLTSASAWTQGSVGVAAATDISGSNQNAATLTSSTGSAFSFIDEWIKVQPGQTYTLTDYVASTSNATAFPALSVQTDDSSKTEFVAVIDTNKGAAVEGSSSGPDAGNWGSGAVTTTVAAAGSSWWKVSMSFTTPVGSNNAAVFLHAPVASAAGVRGPQTAGVAATHYCPSLAITSTLTTATQ
jgi:non-reducing end alpha-L-arabinofuranosidase